MYLIGSYSEGDNLNSLYKVEIRSGKLLLVDTIESGLNPSYLISSSDELVLINEISESDNIRTLKRNGELKSIFASGGVGPCHINKFEKYIAISNYTSGSISLLKGSKLLDSHTFNGDGPHERQESPHVHSSLFYNGILYTVDLGRDSVDSFIINDNKLELSSSFKLAPGDGPRMMEVYKGRGYIVNELSNSVSVVGFGEDGLYEIAKYSTLPNGLDIESYASHIEISNNNLYISNRGYNSIVIFPILEEGLGEPSWIEVEGSFPRHFLIDDGKIIIANQESDSVEVIDLENQKSITSLTIYKPTVVVKLL